MGFFRRRPKKGPKPLKPGEELYGLTPSGRAFMLHHRAELDDAWPAVQFVALHMVATQKSIVSAAGSPAFNRAAMFGYIKHWTPKV